ncbi:OmpA family protein [Flaviaesturariibacter amylovorans]|uniref:OmpA-like domain-containing protein n=1 Tax=Flaviaesturariibacter amylovorans TaxID=1084520 RepID=A0ABP8HPZ9_9BACT
MRHRILLLALLLPALAQSQSLLDRFSDKVKNRVDQKIDQGMDKGLDAAEGKAAEAARKDKTKAQPAAQPAATAASPASTAAPASTATATPAVAATPAAAFKAYSRYDFIPGAEIVYAEDFSQDVIGEFPLKWSTNNRGEAVTIQGLDGKWMQLFKEGHFVSPYIKKLPENFTTEFDLVLHLPPNTQNTNYPEFVIRLMNVETGDDRARKFFAGNFEAKTDVRLVLAPYPEEGSTLSIFSSEGGHNNVLFSQEGKDLRSMSGLIDKPIHVAIWVQKERFRLWINGDKIYDLPQAVPANAAFNRLAFETGSSPYTDNEVGYYISNIRFAQGSADLRSKLLTEGRLVTNGIHFDVSSDRIKPESAGVLQEIAKVLQDNPSVKVKITGHTDSDGDAAKNLALSKQRAAAVRSALAGMGVDASRLQTDGKGAGQPVADNASKEGKAKNRRVEFVKL